MVPFIYFYYLPPHPSVSGRVPRAHSARIHFSCLCAHPEAVLSVLSIVSGWTYVVSSLSQDWEQHKDLCVLVYALVQVISLGKRLRGKCLHYKMCIFQILNFPLKVVYLPLVICESICFFFPIATWVLSIFYIFINPKDKPISLLFSLVVSYLWGWISYHMFIDYFYFLFGELPVWRTVILRRHHASESPVGCRAQLLGPTPISVSVGEGECAILTCSQVMLMLLFWGPDLKSLNQRNRLVLVPPYRSTSVANPDRH